MIGRTLLRYRIEAELGRGGMGVVYRAKDSRLGRDVALKVLSPERFADPELRRRFLQEARTLASLQHPGIAVVHEIEETEGLAFIAMELVPGETLATLLEREDLPLPRLLELAVEIAEALGEAHRKGVVHRDLKPANVLVTPEGRVKLVDFGLARLAHPVGDLGDAVETPARGHTDPGRIIGTVAYLSPEQARGGTVDARSDLFSFGCVLHEMLAGDPPFLAATGVDTLMAVLREPAPRLPPLGPDTAHLQAIVDRCLAKDPGGRYSSAADLLADLRATGAPAPRPVPRERAAPATLRVAVVDDEELARRLLRELLRPHADVTVVAECANGFEAVKAVAEHQPDLLLLDVQMPKLDGFEVLELIGRDVGVVFVTAYDAYALKAFEVHAIDYLLKPVTAERLATALDRVRTRLARADVAPETAALPDLQAARRGDAWTTRVLVRQGARVHVIPVERLDWAQAQDDYVLLRSEGKDHLKEQTLADLEKSLDPARFVRIHRSYLLNVDRLARLESPARDTRVAVLRDGTRLPVSRAGYARLRTLL